MKHLSLLALLAIAAPLTWGRMFGIAFKNSATKLRITSQTVRLSCNDMKRTNSLSNTWPI